MRSPRVRTITFIPSTCCIYPRGSGQYRTSVCVATSSSLHRPYMQFLFVRPGFCCRLPSDSTSRWTPLSLANTPYCQAVFGTFTLELSPMPGTPPKKKDRNISLSFFERLEINHRLFLTLVFLQFYYICQITKKVLPIGLRIRQRDFA